MTRRAPSFARAFTGRWRITEMYEWDEIDLAGSAHIPFSGKGDGKLAFLAVEANLDVRYGSRDGAACAEFPGKASMTVAPPAAAAGPLWGAPAVWSVTSSSIKVMTRLRRRTRVISSTACSQVRLRQGQPVQLRSQPIGSADRRRFLQTAVTGRVSDAGQARDRPGFMTYAESEMDISGCLRRRY